MFVRSARDLGLLIKDKRRELGLSQTDLSRKLKVSQSWLSEVESGKMTAEIGMVLRVLGILGISLDARTESVLEDLDDEVLPYKL